MAILAVSWALLGEAQYGGVSGFIGEVASFPQLVPIVGGVVVVGILEVLSRMGSGHVDDPVADGGSVRPEIPDGPVKNSGRASDWNSRWADEDEV